MRLSDSLNKPTGHLRIEFMRNGVVFDVLDEENLIVDGSKNVHAKLLGGAVTGKSIASVGFGTSGTAPVGGNTALTSPYTKALDSISYPATNQVQFNFSLGSGEANGKAILEFGLITTDGTLYARRIRAGALNKESDISLSGSWVITF